MERITQFAIANSRLTILVLLAVLVAGITTFFTMPSQEDPEITIRTAQVRAYFPGMSTSQVENLIVKPLEKKIKEIAELKEVRSTVSTGTALVEIEIHDRYFELDPIWQDLRNKMEDLKTSLPKGTQGPFVNDDFGRVASATVALYGRGYSLPELYDAARDLQDKLGTLDSISKVDIYGHQPERIYLDFDSSRLAFYGIAPNEIVSALTQQNVVLPGGSITTGDESIVLVPSGNFESSEDVRNLQITVPNSEKTVYLRDIVKIRRVLVDPPKNPIFYNAEPAIVLGISMIARHNIIDFGEELSAKINTLRDALPVGMHMEYATYQPALVKQAVGSAVNNLYQTVAVVLAVVVIFLGLRTGLVVGAIVPLTILLSLVIMNQFDIDLQRMSIAAVIIALGLLVDNGIVIAEDMRSRMDHGVPKEDAAIQAAHSLGVPLLTSSLTTILAFLPLMLSESVTGEYLSTLSKVIIITLLSSWFLALFATPVLCYWFLRESNTDSKTQKESYTGRIYDAYRRFLVLVLNHKLIFVGAMVGLLILSVKGMGLITQQMMPYSDRNQALIYVDLPAGSNMNHTIEATEKLRAWLADEEQNPEIESHVAYIGFGGPRFFLALSPINPGDNVAFMVVNTKNKEDVPMMQARINQFMLDEMPEVNGRVKRMFLGAKEIGLVEYRVIGPDAGELYKLSYDIEKAFRDLPGTVAIKNDWQNPVARISVDIDQLRARRAGVTSESIARSLNAYYDGYSVTDYRDGDKVIPITLRGGEERNDLSGLITLPVLSDDGTPVPLIQVANFSRIIEPDNLLRVDQERTLTVSGKHITLQAKDLHAKLLPVIEGLSLPEGYRIEFGGEVEGSAEANSALFAKMPIALLGIALLLVWQFNSIRRPAIILLTIPLVLIGAVIGLLVTNAFLSFTAMLGLFSLAGIIVNNGIVLIDRIDRERAGGLSVHDATISACITRMRPILMTTLTTVLGLIPLMLFGGALWHPMSIVIIFGLAVGTILTLGFVPALYVALFGFDGSRISDLLTKKNVAASA